MRPQSQRQLCNISTWLPEREVTKQHEGGREGGAGYTCQVQRQFLFTYVKDTIWSPVNLQRPAEPHLAALQTPNSQVRGRIPSLGRKTTGFVNKVGG